MTEAPTIALIVAAGRGMRAGGDIPKQYRTVGGEPVLRRTLSKFLDHPRIDYACAVIYPDDSELYSAAALAHPKLLPPVHGGENRARSVLNGLRALPHCARILIHDGARPFVSAGVIDGVLDALTGSEGAVAAIPAVDAMRRTFETLLADPVPRDGLQRIQTPQGFHFAAILRALESAEAQGRLGALPDDATALIEDGGSVSATMGDPANIKLTTPEDFSMAEALYALPDIRTGQGFDVHAFTEGDHVILCGVRIPHERALAGHSDADVGLHTITDALLGAVAQGDIGRHFPPSDPQWKGVDSAVFLSRAVEIVAENGFAIGNIDLTLICEFPKIGPHSEAMRMRVAEICGVELSRVSVKATTTERLGFPGRGEGIAGLASATVIRRSA